VPFSRAEISAQPSLKAWRHWLRFSVRGLLVLVLVIGGGLGWIVHQAHVQRDAVGAITRAGGSVMYDWEWNNGKSVPGGKPWAPRWLVDLIGVDYFGHVAMVDLWGAHVTDAELLQLHLRGLTDLSYLTLIDGQVSDAGIEKLKQALPRLTIEVSSGPY
jgi:hypothetical protein